MGDYATTTSFSQLLPYFLKSNTTTSDSDGTAMLETHITRAESKVKSAVAQQYSLPFSTIPPLLRTLTEDITSFYAIRGAFTQDGQSRNPYFEDFKMAMDTLKEIYEGNMSLALTDGSLVPKKSSNKVKSNTQGYAPTFDLDNPTAWAVDQDRLDAIENARD